MLDIIARARITKVDAKQRLVYGRATQEVVDKSNEIFDYARSKPHFEQWSNAASAATKAAGQDESLGNVRAMHGAVAAGKLTAIEFNDAEKAIDVCAHIVDDAEWAKVEQGVYTGFSIGGAYADRWPDPTNAKLKRFEAIPAEISIVDNPCVPTATFEMIKADGCSELRKFASVETPEAVVADSTEQPAGGTPAGDAPSDVASDVAKAAVPAAPEIPAPDAAEAGPVSPASAPPAAAPVAVAKSMYDLAQMADVLSGIASLVSSSTWEAMNEGDQSPMPEQLRGWLADGAKLLQAMTAEEVAELVASASPAVPKLAAAPTDDLAKGKSPAQAIHDHAVGMGASCSSAKADAQADLTKLMASAADVTKLATERDELQKRADDLAKRVAELEAQPAPAKGAIRAVPVAKSADSGDGSSSDTIELPSPDSPEFAKAVMKAVHARGAKPLSQI